MYRSYIYISMDKHRCNFIYFYMSVHTPMYIYLTKFTYWFKLLKTIYAWWYTALNPTSIQNGFLSSCNVKLTLIIIQKNFFCIFTIVLVLGWLEFWETVILSAKVYRQEIKITE